MFLSALLTADLASVRLFEPVHQLAGNASPKVRKTFRIIRSIHRPFS